MSARRSEPKSTPPREEGLVTCMADVRAKEVAWLWRGRLPAGMLVLLDGPPAAGKSTVVADLAARLTTGRAFPGDPPRGRLSCADVVLIGAEDSPEHTLRPRLDAAGADPRRVHLFTGRRVGSGHRTVRFPDDVDELERIIKRAGALLAVVDPVSGYVGQVDLHRDNDMRAALTPLAGVAQRTGAAILMVRHLRKSGGTAAINRGMGSIAISALARAGLMLLADPDDRTARILAWAKLSVGPVPRSLRCRLAGDEGAPRVQWEGTSDLSADDILSRQDRALRGDGESQRARDDAGDWLLAELAQRSEFPVGDLLRRASAAGFSEMTVKRARQELGIEARRVGGVGGAGRWVWSLPTAAGPKKVSGPGGERVTFLGDDNDVGPSVHAKKVTNQSSGILTSLAAPGAGDETPPKEVTELAVLDGDGGVRRVANGHVR